MRDRRRASATRRRRRRARQGEEETASASEPGDAHPGAETTDAGDRPIPTTDATADATADGAHAGGVVDEQRQPESEIRDAPEADTLLRTAAEVHVEEPARQESIEVRADVADRRDSGEVPAEAPAWQATAEVHVEDATPPATAVVHAEEAVPPATVAVQAEAVPPRDADEDLGATEEPDRDAAAAPPVARPKPAELALTPEVRTALAGLDRQFDAIRAMPKPVDPADRSRLQPADVRAGGYLTLRGEPYRVVERNRYDGRQSTWFELELFGLASGQVRSLEWESNAPAALSLNGPPLALEDVGTTWDVVEDISDEGEGELEYAGRTYLFDDDYGAKFLRGERGSGENAYFFDFETRDEDSRLTVEEWGDQEHGYTYRVFVSQPVDAQDVEVLATGPGG